MASKSSIATATQNQTKIRPSSTQVHQEANSLLSHTRQTVSHVAITPSNQSVAFSREKKKNLKYFVLLFNSTVFQT